MTFRTGYLESYVPEAPLPLALERVAECALYRDLGFERPILDLGCGDGLFASRVFAEPIDTGIDPNQRELQEAKRHGGYAELLPCLGSAIPKSSESFGTVLSNSVLEHIEDLDPVLREVFRILKPDGDFYVTVPSHLFERFTVVHTLLAACGARSAAGRYGRWFNRFWVHHHTYDKATWERRFMSAGFRIVRSSYYNSRSSCLLNDLLVPLALPGFIFKKTLNRWTILPGLRRVLLVPLARFLQRTTAPHHDLAEGGLVFLHLRKPR